MKPVRKILLTPAVALATALSALSLPAEIADRPDERSLAYRYDAELGWFPRANDEITYTGMREIHIAHNAMGFRDRPHAPTKTKPRLVFLGDSFVWGYDVEQEERFTDLLRAELDAIEVLNFGVSGYGTDQSYLLIRKYFDDYRPDAVIYMFSATDVRDNSVNFNYGAYYKPYYVLVGGELELRGVPVPRSSIWTRWVKAITDRFPRLTNKEDLTPRLVSALDAFVKAKGASFAVGLIDDHPPLREHLAKEKIVHFDLTHVDERFRYSGHGFHWTPEGHRQVASAVRAFLLHNRAR
jgi:lysophospholipase L1-like esterase